MVLEGGAPHGVIFQPSPRRRMMSVESPQQAVPAPTASGWLALLQEDDATLRLHALQQLLPLVDTLWHEIAPGLPDLEALAAEDCPPAAALASRVLFHLQEPTMALQWALQAGDYWDPLEASPYVERLVAAALEAYTNEEQDSGLPMDQLKAMVHRLLQASCEKGQFAYALGIALEAQEVSQVQWILQQAGPSLLPYALESSIQLVRSKAFRVQVLQVIAHGLETEFASHPTWAAHYLWVTHQLLQQPEPVAQVLCQLFTTTDQSLLALQLCFDLVDAGDQAFVQQVAEALQRIWTTEPSALRDRAFSVLTGGFSAALSLSFLHKQSKADRLVMETLKKTLEERSSGSRSSILHTAAVVTHSYLYAGTTNDSFLRDHLDWMKKASNWYVGGFVVVET